MKRFLVLIAVFTIFTSATTMAQELSASTEVSTITPTAGERQRFDIGAGYWYTWSSLDSYVYNNDLGGQKISELNNDINAGLFLVNVDAWIWWRIHAGGYIALGDFDGENKDSDWRLPNQIYYDGITWGDAADYYGLDLNQPYSVSKSDATGGVTTWNLNGYFRILDEPKEDKGYLDAALGYQYYRDDIKHLENSTLYISDWVSVNEPILGDDSQDRYTYGGFRIGLRGKIRLHEKIALKASAGVMPWIEVKNKGYWNLREMNIDASANATAFDLMGGVEIKIMKHFFIEAGYKYMSFDSDKGDDKRTWSDGTSITYKDAFKAEGHRGGFYAMGRCKF